MLDKFRSLSGQQMAFPGVSNMLHGNLGEGLVRIGADYSGLRRQTEEAMAEMRLQLAAGTRGLNTGAANATRLGNELKATAGHATVLATALKAAGLGLAVAVIGGLGESIKAAVDWQNAFIKLRGVVTGTQSDLDKFGQSLIDLSKTMPMTATQLAEIATSAGSLGVAQADLLKFTDAAAKLSKVTDISAQDAATTLAQLGHQLKLSGDDYSRFGSTLVALGHDVSSKLLDIVKRASAAASLIGLPAPALVAFASTLVKVGQDSGLAGTALSKMFYVINQAQGSAGVLADLAKQAHMSEGALSALAAKGGKDYTALATKIGMSTGDITKAIKAAGVQDQILRLTGMTKKAFTDLYNSHPEQAILNIIDGLHKLSSTDLQAALKNMGLSDVRSARVFQALTSNVDLLKTSITQAGEAFKANTALTDEANVRFATLGSQLDILKNNLVAIAIAVGTVLLPPLISFVKWLGNALPAALNALGAIWKSTLEGPLVTVWQAVVKLGQALGQILFDWGSTGKGSQIEGVFGGIAKVVALLAADLANVVNLMADLLANPIINGLAKMVVLLGAASVAIRAIGMLRGLVMGTVGAFAGLGRSLARDLTFGRLGGTGAAAADPAVAGQLRAAEGQQAAADAQLKAAGMAEGAAAGLTKAAALTTEADAALVRQMAVMSFANGPMVGSQQIRAAEMVRLGTGPLTQRELALIRGGQLNYGTGLRENQFGNMVRTPLTARQAIVPGGRAIGTGSMLGPNGQLLAVGLSGSDRAFYAANQKYFDSAGRGILGSVYGRVSSAVGAGAGLLRRGAGALASGASAVFSGISRVIWPLIIADLIGNLVAGPIADFIAKDPGLQRLAGEWRKGWIDGLIATAQHVIGNVPDNYLGRAGSYGIPTAPGSTTPGGVAPTVQIPTDALQQLGIDTTLLDRIEKGGTDAIVAQAALAQKISDATTRINSQGDQASAADRRAIQLIGEALKLPGTTSVDLPVVGRVFDISPGVPQIQKAIIDAMTAGGKAAATDLAAGVAAGAKQAGFDVLPYKLEQLPADVLGKLSDILNATLPSGMTQEMLQAFQKFALREAVGVNPGLAKADTTPGGIAASVAANMATIGKDAAALKTWIESQHAANPALFDNIQKWFTRYAYPIMAASGQSNVQRASVIGTVLGTKVNPKDKKQVDALWTQVMQMFTSASQFTGQDQKSKIADNVQATLTDALKHGVSLVNASTQIDFGLLFDGIGPEKVSIAKRITAALQGAMADSMRKISGNAATKKAQIDLWNSLVPDPLKISGGTLDTQIQKLVTYFVATFSDQIKQADTAAEQNAVTSLFNKSMPKDQQLTFPQLKAKLSATDVQAAVTSLGSSVGDVFTQLQSNLGDGANVVGAMFGDWLGKLGPVFTQIKGVVEGADLGTVPSPKFPDLFGAGAAMMGSAIAGAQSQYAQFLASLHSVLGMFGMSFPNSPEAKIGPLKGRKLHDMGAGLIHALRGGMMAAGGLAVPPIGLSGSIPFRMPVAPPMPALAMGGGGSAVGSAAPDPWQVPPMTGSGGGTDESPQAPSPPHHQTLNIGHMTILGPADEQSVLYQLQFMDPTGG